MRKNFWAMSQDTVDDFADSDEAVDDEDDDEDSEERPLQPTSAINTMKRRKYDVVLHPKCTDVVKASPTMRQKG